MTKIPGEYIAVSRALWRLDVGHLAWAAHTMPVSPDEAAGLLRHLCGPIVVTFRGYRGRARRDGSCVTMPSVAGVRPDGAPYLRLGIVLHEAAHVLAFRRYGRRIAPHGREFCETLAQLLREY